MEILLLEFGVIYLIVILSTYLFTVAIDKLLEVSSEGRRTRWLYVVIMILVVLLTVFAGVMLNKANLPYFVLMPF
jgi:hypothetical protein